jgi:hypothetical protein
MKKCAKCKIYFEIDNFPKDNSKKDKHKSYCFSCNREVINKATLKRKDKRHLDNIKNQKLIQEYNKKYYNSNKHIFQSNYKKYLKTNPNFKIIHNTRVRINKALKLNLKNSSSIDLLGCSIKEYKLYLESQFGIEMTWENYGRYWDIDHIKPCALFDLSDPKQQKECFNYKNTQPLSKIENQQKNKFY